MTDSDKLTKLATNLLTGQVIALNNAVGYLMENDPNPAPLKMKVQRNLSLVLGSLRGADSDSEVKFTGQKMVMEGMLVRLKQNPHSENDS